MDRRQALHRRRRRLHDRARQDQGRALRQHLGLARERRRGRRSTVKFNFSKALPGVGHLDLQQPDPAEAHLGGQGQRGHPQGHQRQRRRHRPVQVPDRRPRTAWSGSRTTTGGAPRPSPRRQAQVHRRHRQRRQQRRARPADAGRHRPSATTSCPASRPSSTRATLRPTTRRRRTCCRPTPPGWPPTTQDADGRRRIPQAIANAVNTPDIVNKVYGNIVKAADPTGLLPTWDKYIDTGQRRRSSASSTTPTKAQASLLDDAGYKKGGDGFVTNKDGSPIKLTIMVPTGWSDWEASAT